MSGKTTDRNIITVSHTIYVLVADNSTVQALYDSLHNQEPTIANAMNLPSWQTLRDIFDQLRLEGTIIDPESLLGGSGAPDGPQSSPDGPESEPMHAGINSNFHVDHLGQVLERWGTNHGVNLQLMVQMGDRQILPIATILNNPTQIWIYNDDAQFLNPDIPDIVNHYEGMRPDTPSTAESPNGSGTEVDVDEPLSQHESDNPHTP
ncbi:hypothetical protein BKA67DRAFT_251384 [Truncatella angustata]|uniref:Uncharacterized protein n=1 Tax=Truncatella angustata TaxID=152316 RepID=A0A9P8UP69_9PEZI|nr:uncharacterized protein BKA67DRAFT_251384 [Truncatella angustata]KAH6655891.1 hypothetical protein BKA67DRAFT_251384 [Truncatella angustata]